VTETPFFFPGKAYSLFGVLHRPTQVTRDAFVFCHPFGEEKLWSHRVLVSFARRLAEAGHTVLRFDYMGNGDSDGDFSASSLTTACDDVRAAMTELRRHTGATRVSLLGLRLGCEIAELVANETPEIERLVLWAPIGDGARYMQELLRINVATQTSTLGGVRRDRVELVRELQQGNTVNIDGYEIARVMYEEVAMLAIPQDPNRFTGPCLIAQIDRVPGQPSRELKQLATSFERATLQVAQEEPFWKEIARFYDTAPNLFALTLEWLSHAANTAPGDTSEDLRH
jgi:exosortase A-associated hydrolase 2